MDKPVASEQGKRFWLADLVLVLSLLGLAAKMTYHIAAVRDVGMGDEASYMCLGLQIPEYGLPPASLNPLYCLWYLALSYLQPDRVKLFFLSWSVLAALEPVSLYVLARASRRPALRQPACRVSGTDLAIGERLAIRAAPLRGRAGPGDRGDRPLPVLDVALGHPRHRSAARQPHPAGVVPGLPDLLCRRVGIALVQVLRGAVRPLRLVVPVLVLLGGGLGLGWLFGVPMGSRPFMAFGQHYAVNVATATDSSFNPWIHWESFVRADFGSAQTVGDAWRTNPRAFLWHLGVNAATLPAALGNMVTLGLDLPRRVSLVVASFFILAGIAGGVGLLRGCGIHRGTRSGSSCLCWACCWCRSAASSSSSLRRCTTWSLWSR